MLRDDVWRHILLDIYFLGPIIVIHVLVVTDLTASEVLTHQCGPSLDRTKTCEYDVGIEMVFSPIGRQ